MQPQQNPQQLARVVFFSVVAALGGFLFGFDSAVINGTVQALQDTFRSTTVGTGFSVASMLLGCAAGALAAGTIADHVGRRPVMIVAAIAFLVGALGSGWSATSLEFVFYRLLGGLAVGAASVIAPAYIAEISPAAIRGTLASLQQLAIVLGIFVALLSNYFIASLAGGANETWLGGWPAWSWMYWMEAPPSAAYLLLLLFIPESPRLLVARGRDEEARHVLQGMVSEEEATHLIDAIKKSLRGAERIRLTDIFQPGTMRLWPIVWVGVILAALQQLSGINVIFYYGAVLWQAAGFSEQHALLINVVSGVINISSTLVAMVLIDKLGRRPLLLAGAVAMSCSLGAVAWVFSQAGLGDTGQLVLTGHRAWIALIAANAFVFAFGTTWGPCLWVLLSEIFNNRIRGSAMALATFVLWMANFLVTMTFPILLTQCGLGGAYFAFMAFAVISWFFTYFYISETRGRALEVADSQ